ncbi:YokU family protein [Peribacillus simplex]|nr:YokU family protein [Peribacillus simplex]MCM3673186.1 YokU family protein [Peribacillus simplex]
MKEIENQLFLLIRNSLKNKRSELMNMKRLLKRSYFDF